MRVPAMQAWPFVVNKPACTAKGMAAARSASSRMIVGGLAAQFQGEPRFIVSTPLRAMIFPVAVEPVMDTLATSVPRGDQDLRRRPAPGRRCRGRPARRRSAPVRCPPATSTRRKSYSWNWPEREWRPWSSALVAPDSKAATGLPAGQPSPRRSPRRSSPARLFCDLLIHVPLEPRRRSEP